MALSLKLHGIGFDMSTPVSPVKVSIGAEGSVTLSREEAAQVAAFINIAVCGGDEALITAAIEQMVTEINSAATKDPPK